MAAWSCAFFPLWEFTGFTTAILVVSAANCNQRFRFIAPPRHEISRRLLAGDPGSRSSVALCLRGALLCQGCVSPDLLVPTRSTVSIGANPRI